MRKKYLLWLLVLTLSIVSSCSSTGRHETDRKEHAVELTTRAKNEFWGKDWQKVIDLTTRAIEADPMNPWPYSLRGAAFNALGQYRRAIKDLNAALDISPDYAPAYTNKAISFLRLRDYPIARMNADEALVLDRANLTVLMVAAEVYSAINDEARSCALLLEAVGLGFRDFSVLKIRQSFSTLHSSPCLEQALALATSQAQHENRQSP